MTQQEYQTISEIKDPLVFVEKTENVAYGDIVEVETPDGEVKTGEVLETSKDVVVVQLYEDTQGVGRDGRVRFMDENVKMPVTKDLLGRVLDGTGEPMDDGPEIIPEEERDIIGEAINPYSRELPEDFIQTGVSSIDVMNTLVRGQKLPIFSGSGLPHNDLAMQIARQADVKGEDTDFAVVFAGMGITEEESQEFIEELEETGALERSVVFLNKASDPAPERIITPRMALTTAEYLAYEEGMEVLVVMTDMTNYCNALREVSAAREEVPGRRGYPGYMYTDLANLYERAGIIEGKEGSVTQIPILTMVGDDITHPIPDLTGYITEGQIVVDRDLDNQGYKPPVDVLPSLSRLEDNGIGEGFTREDHGDLSDQLYAMYAEGNDLRDLVSIVGEDALSDRDEKVLEFARNFESEFIDQGWNENRSIEESLDKAWSLLEVIPEGELTRVDPELREKYLNTESEEEE
ncbi:V-type ATP synthase subunit B [Candidatus Nanohalobium constans]|uniref:A-type ATP synthase subunit B n=1 Tax=Candidatus Nanohalobium constans TaxID=2565781 RepID=A0A5Q0UGJ2_9ARCH|nr:V-type ATP synthase subunit B [Candidatus Nanohalobium constans]QGA80714.1 V/A-type H+/Na+-transporting ATPase subunit B [Candidatus Nanohalobium constans]